MTTSSTPAWRHEKGRVFGHLMLDGQPVLRDDFDTAPAQAYIDSIWTWVCSVLNGEKPGVPIKRGEWRYNNGFLCCGTFRIASLPWGMEVEYVDPAVTERLEAAVHQLNAAVREHLLLEPGPR